MPRRPAVPGTLTPSLDFIRRLSRVNHALETLSSRMERELGVTAQQRLLIRCIGRNPGVTAGRLAEELHLDPGTISASLRRLERRKLVSRRREKEDRRRVTLALTAAGRALDVPTRGTVEHVVERLLRAAGNGDVEAVKGVLERFAHLLERESEG